MPKVTVVDYGIGNVLSVMRAFEHCDAEVLLSNGKSDIENADYLVLPGVGAFADGMKGLENMELVDSIKRFAKKGNPFMGICLGMQMMLDESEEFGVHEGLGLIPGRVVGIERTSVDGEPHKIPHIGWNELTRPSGSCKERWDGTILSGIEEKETVYFVHSFTAVPSDSSNYLADTYYGGRRISAAIQKDNLYGCQFHPEKSGKIGIEIIKNFLQLRG